MEISVVIPIYNTGSKLSFTIQSIISQTFPDWELLLIDDGSSDACTIDICKKFEAKDSRVKYISKKNEGIEKSRIYGIKQAKGRYIMFLDHDDWYSADALKKLLDTALENNSDIVVASNYESFHPRIKYNRKGHSINKNISVDHKEFLQTYYINFFGVNMYPVSTWSKLYRASLFEDLDLKTLGYNIMEDVVLNLQIFPKAKRISFVDDYLYFHRFGGLTTKVDTINALSAYLDLYRFKQNFITKYQLEKGTEFINYEVKNVLVHMLRLSFGTDNPKANFLELIHIFQNDVIYDEVLLFFERKNPILNKIDDHKIEDLYSELQNERKNMKFKIMKVSKNIFRKYIFQLLNYF